MHLYFIALVGCNLNKDVKLAFLCSVKEKQKTKKNKWVALGLNPRAHVGKQQ